MLTVSDARKGDIVRFRGHALRVEAEPTRKGQRIMLEGRENRNGCPYVRRWYFTNVPVVSIERADNA